MVFVAKSIARRDILDSDDSRDVARVTSLDVFALVRLNLNQTRDAFALVRARIVNRVAFGKGAGINTEEDKLANKRVAPKFESKRTKRRVIICRRLHRLVRVGGPALCPPKVHR